MTSVISNAHRHGTRVVLTLSVFAWTTAQANTQRAILGSKAARVRLAKQAVAAVRDRGADGVNLDFEPLASGYSDEFVALLKTFRTQLNKVRKGYQLTYDTTGYIGNYPLEASVGKGAADAIFVMGYDYRTSSSGTAGSIDPLSGPAYDLADTVRAYTARVSPSRVILGLPWYGRAWSTDDNAPRSKTLPGAKYGYSAAVNYENVVDLVAKHGRKWDALERSPYVVYRRAELHLDLWLRDQLAAGLLRRRRVAQAALRDRQRLRPARGRDVGARLRRRSRRAQSRPVGVVPRRQVRAPGRHPDARHRAGRRGVRRLVAGARHQQHRLVRRPGLGRRRPMGRVAHEDPRPVRGLARLRRPRLRVPRPRGRQQGQRRQLERGLALGRRAQRWRTAGSGGSSRTASRIAAARTPRRPSWERSSADTIVAITRGPVSSDGYSWYEVTEPIREWSPVSFVERGVWIAAKSSSDTIGQALPRAQQHDRRRGDPRPQLRRRAGVGRGLGADRAGRPRVLAQRRRLGGRRAPPVDATPSRSTR